MNRIWMPCVDCERAACLWDIEFSVSTERIVPEMLEKLHAVSSGVLFRQVIKRCVYMGS